MDKYQDHLAICCHGRERYVAEWQRPNHWRWCKNGIEHEGRFTQIQDEVTYIFPRDVIRPFEFNGEE